MKCLACGSEAMVGGTVMNSGDGGSTVFKLDDVPAWKSMFGAGTRTVRAYGCVHCQYLQLAVDFSDNDRERYRQFEGEQPDLLGRLRAEEEEN